MAGISAGQQGSASDPRRQSPRLFSYRTDDSIATVHGTAGYFNELIDTNDFYRSTLQEGDLIFAACSSTGPDDPIVAPAIFRVATVSAAEIDVTLGDTL